MYRRALRGAIGLGLFVLAWHLAIGAAGNTLLPAPLAVLRGIAELASKDLLLKYMVASLFRVTWGYVGALVVGIPLGLGLGWSRRGERAFGFLIQLLRPISPLAWIPLSILWFGVGEVSAVFIIFLASLWPITLAAMNAVRNVPDVHLNAGRNFGLNGASLLLRIVLPSSLPQLMVGMRLALGVAWLVDVAAEMIAVNSGLGFLIISARNAGNRYDLVVAGMVLIGTIGLILDFTMQRLERLHPLAVRT